MAVVALALAGLQGWKIVNALVDAERNVVVPLPTRESDVELGGAARSGAEIPVITPDQITPTDVPSSAQAAVVATQPPATATHAPAVEPTKMPNVTVPATVESSQPPPSPTATAVHIAAASEPPTATSPPPAPTVAPTDTPAVIREDATGGPEVTAASAPVQAQPTVASAAQTSDGTPASNGQAASSNDDNPSAFDIVRNVVDAGLDSGDPGTSEVWNGQTEITILVVGLDRRPDGGDQNADVIMIAQLDLINKTVRAVSLPRDLLVQIPNIGYDKINSAYNYGIKANPDDPAAGVAMVRDTIEYNFGIPIDHYVLVDFNGFKKVIDATGGIDVNVPYDIVDDEYPTENYGTERVYFPAGPMHMDGETALKYVRTRHADSDDQRRERQMQVLEALFAQGKQIGSINKIDNMIVALGSSAQTSFTLQQQLTLARLALEIDSANIIFSSLAPPLLQSGYTESGAWVYTGDMNEIIAFIKNAIYGGGQ